MSYIVCDANGHTLKRFEDREAAIRWARDKYTGMLRPVQVWEIATDGETMVWRG